MNVASFIDHTVLKADCTPSDIQRICTEARQYQFAAVCIPPYYVADAAQQLENSGVKVATVIGFPMGYATTSAKVEEIKRAMDDGADELDVVINLCAVRSNQWNYVRDDIDRMSTTIRLKGKVVKVILETGLLQEAEIIRLCEICKELTVDFVKTSTGFNGEGATVYTVELLKQCLQGTTVKIKASGGIRTREDAQRLIEAGAQRLGCSASVMIISE